MPPTFKDILASKRLDPLDTSTLTNVTESSSYNNELQDVKNQYRIYLSLDPDLCKKLRSVGLGEVMIVKVIDFFDIKNAHKKIFEEDPYNLMKVDGIGFKKADNVALQLGIQKEDPRRQRALIMHVLETNKNFGHIYAISTVLEKECRKEGVLKFQERLNELFENCEIILDGNRIYLTYLYIAECETANYIRLLIGKESKTCKGYEELNIRRKELMKRLTGRD